MAQPPPSKAVQTPPAASPTRCFSVVASESFRRSPQSRVLTACEAATPLRFNCQDVASLEADLMLSARTGVVFVSTDEATSHIAQNPRVELARSVFKRFVVVAITSDNAATRATLRHPGVVQLRNSSSCRGVIVSTDCATIASELLAIASQDAEDGFAIPEGEHASPSQVVGVDPHFPARFQFFRATNVLSLGSVASLSFRFDKFRVAQIPVAKFNEMHWRRMLPWVAQDTAQRLYSCFLSSSKSPTV